MNWTTTQPTEPGFYWWKDPADSEVFFVEVFQRADGLRLRYFPDDANELFDAGAWYGPVPVEKPDEHDPALDEAPL